MISRHLFKMLFGLIGMGLFGIICLVLINLYHKQLTADTSGAVQQAAGANRDFQGH